MPCSRKDTITWKFKYPKDLDFNRSQVDQVVSLRDIAPWSKTPERKLIKKQKVLHIELNPTVHSFKGEIEIPYFIAAIYFWQSNTVVHSVNSTSRGLGTIHPGTGAYRE